MRDIDQSNMEQDRVKSVDSKLNLLIEKLNFKISVLETRVAKLEARQLDPKDGEPRYPDYLDPPEYDSLIYLIGAKVKVRDIQGVWMVESFTVYPEYLIYNLVDQNRKVNLKVNESNIQEFV